MYHDYDMQKIIDHIVDYTRKNKKKKLILDTDTYNEIDDQFAVTYAMVAEDIEVIGMTAAPFTNERSTGPADGMEKSYEELLRVRNFVDPENKMNIPCYRGSTEYMKNIITPVKSEAAENIVRLVREADDIVYIAVIGCFTNVASALLLDPSISDKAVIVLLGTSKFECGTANDFNLAQDRNAARVIFECGVPVVVIPASGGCADTLMITNAEADFYLGKESGKIGKFLCQNFFEDETAPFDENGNCCVRERSIYDIATIAFLRNPFATGVRIITAHSVDDKGNWVKLNTDRKMIYINDLYRDHILSEFFTSVRRANLK